MPRNPDDPIERKRQELLEQMQRLEAEQAQLRAQLQPRENPESDLNAPPIWKNEEEILPGDALSQLPPRPLARQIQKDKITFFIVSFILLGVIALFYFLYRHYTS